MEQMIAWHWNKLTQVLVFQKLKHLLLLLIADLFLEILRDLESIREGLILSVVLMSGGRFAKGCIGLVDCDWDLQEVLVVVRRATVVVVVRVVGVCGHGIVLLLIIWLLLRWNREKSFSTNWRNVLVIIGTQRQRCNLHSKRWILSDYGLELANVNPRHWPYDFDPMIGLCILRLYEKL